MLSKSLIQFSVEGCVPSLLFDLRPNYGEGNASSVGKESTCRVGDPSSIPGLGRPAGEGKKLPTPVF